MSMIEGLRVAMLGTTDGDFIDPDSDIPAGEMFRLAAEYIEVVVKQLEAAWHRGMTLGDTQYIVDDDQIDLAMTDIWTVLHGPTSADVVTPKEPS